MFLSEYNMGPDSHLNGTDWNKVCAVFSGVRLVALPPNPICWSRISLFVPEPLPLDSKSAYGHSFSSHGNIQVTVPLWWAFM